MIIKEYIRRNHDLCTPVFKKMDKKWNIFRLATEVLKDGESSVKWCQENGLLPMSKMCPQCKNKPMPIFYDRNGLGEFKCQKQHGNRGPIQRQIAEGTWFHGHKIPIQKCLLLMYAFANKMSYEDAIRETSLAEVTSSATVADWYSYCREVCLLALDKKYEDEGKIGGPGHVVEIDESKIGKRKFNKGRWVEGSWVLGMIDLEGGFRLEICPDNKRDKDTLESLITKHVADGSTIMTDCWKGYNGLEEIGFQHLTVNHKYNFVDPDTWANTQTIESNWRPLKKRLTRGGVPPENLADHMCEYLWMLDKKNVDRFMALVEDIRNIYQM